VFLAHDLFALAQPESASKMVFGDLDRTRLNGSPSIGSIATIKSMYARPPFRPS